MAETSVVWILQCQWPWDEQAELMGLFATAADATAYTDNWMHALGVGYEWRWEVSESHATMYTMIDREFWGPFRASRWEVKSGVQPA